MILIEKTEIMGLEPAIRGMRNPMNSWAKSDSGTCEDINCNACQYGSDRTVAGACEYYDDLEYMIGPNDLDLMLRLAKAGSVDGKFRRMIAVYVDITAPLYWWKEFDTYKVGTVANSCSTMHKIHAKKFTLDDFSHEHLDTNRVLTCYAPGEYHFSSLDLLKLKISALNYWRNKYLELSKIDEEAWKNAPKSFGLTDGTLAEAKKFVWWQMIQLLPSSYNQKRTVMLNYEVLANIYQHRRNHKLDEWREVCRWIESLPYSEIITCNVTEKDKTNALTSAIAKLKAEQWSEEEIVNLLLSQTKKEQVKLFADGKDTTPVHGGAVDIPAVMADGTKNY